MIAKVTYVVNDNGKRDWDNKEESTTKKSDNTGSETWIKTNWSPRRKKWRPDVDANPGYVARGAYEGKFTNI